MEAADRQKSGTPSDFWHPSSEERDKFKREGEKKI